MKSALIISLFFFIPFIKAQDFKPISSIDQVDGPKIILLSADWCSICKKAKQILTSNPVQEILQNQELILFELDIETEEVIVYNGVKRHFVPTGIGTGDHEIINALGVNSDILSPPVYVFLNKENDVSYIHYGIINESDWLSFFTTGDTHF